jgi:hypothetical protein
VRSQYLFRDARAQSATVAAAVMHRQCASPLWTRKIFFVLSTGREVSFQSRSCWRLRLSGFYFNTEEKHNSSGFKISQWSTPGSRWSCHPTYPAGRTGEEAVERNRHPERFRQHRCMFCNRYTTDSFSGFTIRHVDTAHPQVLPGLQARQPAAYVWLLERGADLTAADIAL